jgi:rhamnosyltransferase
MINECLLQQSKICAVIVCYYPEMAELEKLLTTLEEQQTDAIIVDNSEGETTLINWLKVKFPKVDIVMPPENVGLGKAHNMGIQYALAHHYDYVLQLDQDSLPQPGMVNTLLKAYLQLQAAGIKVAAVGPNWLDTASGKPTYCFQYQGLRTVKTACACHRDACHQRCDYLITSGSLIALKNFNLIGLLDETLFIDAIDIEWGLRAKSKGYACYRICSATMPHTLGDEVKTVFNHNFYYHKPFRHYYIFRNNLLLCRRSYISLGWKLNTFYKLLIRAVIYPIVFKPHGQHLKAVLQGSRDGFLGKIGRVKFN